MRIPDAILCAVIAASLLSFVRAPDPEVQARVARIVGADGSAIDTTDVVELIKFGTATPSSLKRGDQLGSGDEIRAKHAGMTVVLACLENLKNEFTLDGNFRVVIMQRPAGTPCYLDLYSGTAHVSGDSATGLGIGDATLTAKRTQYAATVSRDAGGVRHELLVFEGEVEARFLERGMIRVLQGFALAIGGADSSRLSIRPEQIQAAARLYARVDASGVDPSARSGAAESLYVAYRGHLARPGDNAARLALVTAQVRYGVSNRRTLRQIERVTATAPPSHQLEMATTALSAAVYAQLGDHEQAARYQAQHGDTSVRNAGLRAYGIDPGIVDRVMVHVPPVALGDFEEGIDRPGNDFLGFSLSEAQPLLCRSACTGDSRCRAWTYVGPGVQGPTARCYLKSAVGQPQSRACCTSGVNRSLEERIDRAGNDFRSFALSSAQPGLCRSACAGDSRCRAWTYVRPGVQGPTAQCYLKSAVSQPQPNSCCTSGIIMDEVGIDRPGNDIKAFPLAAAQPSLCRDACGGSAQCRAWTYVRPGVQGPRAQCYLKSAPGEPRLNASCTSGVVHR